MKYKSRYEHLVIEMELTLEQALQKGIEAHKAGKAQEADLYYTAILKANPKHSDANHNMGVLAVGVGKVEAALTFFKIALEGNTNIAQYWLSYIDALIKLDRVDDAKNVLEKAKSQGVKGDSFDQIDKTLVGLAKGTGANAASRKPRELPEAQLQLLINLYGRGEYKEAQAQASQLLNQFPSSVNLYNIIGVSNKGLGKLEEAIEAYSKILSLKPEFAEAHYNMGNAFREQGKLKEAIEAYNKVLAIQPDFAEAYYNMGIAFKNLGKLEQAIEAYNKALSIKPDYADAYNNMGNAKKEQGKLDEAIEAFTKTLNIKPDDDEAYNNMGNSLRDQGRLEEAIEAYTKALSINPQLVEAWDNIYYSLQGIKTRLSFDTIKRYSPKNIDTNYAKIANAILQYRLHRGRRNEESCFDQALSLLSGAQNRTIQNPTFDPASNSKMPALPSKMVALVHFGRSGTGLMHSLIDGHPKVSTLPSIYFSQYFDHSTWAKIISGGRKEMVSRFISIYDVLFTASSPIPIKSKSQQLKYSIGIEEGMTNLGDEKNEILSVNKPIFRSELNRLIDYHEEMDASIFFRLVHAAFDKAISDQTVKSLIFYHIHNPDTYAQLNFIRFHPKANWIMMVREPIQSCESWIRQNYQKYEYSKIANKITGMLFEIDTVVYHKHTSIGIRLEDLKESPKKVIPAICKWMDIEETENLYKMTAQGKKWWGDPSSPDYTKDGMVPFGKKSIKRKVGSILSKNDQFILRTLFYPFRVRFGYTAKNEKQFKADLKKIRPMVDSMFDFEKKIAEEMQIGFEQFINSGSYLYLRSCLLERWSTLNAFGTYPNMIKPLKI